ncbi:MAG: hypothetical protein ACI855_003803, partial [Myxococcota bacterium]
MDMETLSVGGDGYYGRGSAHVHAGGAAARA